MEKSNSEKVYLIIDSQVYPILAEITTVGRKLSNDIVIKNEMVSRVHAEIRCEHGWYVVYDKQSTGGSFVNNKRVDRCVLFSGDIISLAGVQIMFINNNSHLQKNQNAVTKSLQ